MKWRKKPVVIQAVQYNGKNGNELKRWSGNIVIESPVLEPSKDNPDGAYVQIKTLEGVITGIIGDWIIKGVNGEFYPCKPDIFQKTYEHADESSTSVEEVDVYAGVLNTERIKAYKNISQEYNIQESTVRDIFCKGIDWYKKVSSLPVTGEIEAIGFAEWITKNGYDVCGIDKWQLVYGPADDETEYTSSKLYNLYKQQKK